MKRTLVPAVPKNTAATGANHRCATFNFPGDAVTGRKTVWQFPENLGTIAGFVFIAATASAGADLIVDIEDESGSSIFGATKIVIPAGSTDPVTGSGFASTITITVPHSKRFRAFFSQIGSTAAGADVSGNLFY